jgi:hypothetical protein
MAQSQNLLSSASSFITPKRNCGSMKRIFPCNTYRLSNSSVTVRHLSEPESLVVTSSYSKRISFDTAKEIWPLKRARKMEWKGCLRPNICKKTFVSRHTVIGNGAPNEIAGPTLEYVPICLEPPLHQRLCRGVLPVLPPQFEATPGSSNQAARPSYAQSCHAAMAASSQANLRIAHPVS